MAETTIYDIMKATIRYGGDRHYGEFGIEIETESLKKYEYPELKYWHCTKDNSLRNYGVEYVMRAPMDQKELVHALAEFKVCAQKYKFLPNEVSTSVHVHLNFLNDTYKTVANFLTLYAMFENLLVTYSGPDRLSNLFCLPMRDAEGVFHNLMNMLNHISRKNWKGVPMGIDGVKYGGINPAPFTRIGTLEVRTFRGETDTDIISKWVDILMSLKKYARKDITPIDILNSYKTHGNRFLDLVFEKNADELRCKDYESLIKQNLFYAASFATVCKDWSKFGIFKVKKVYKEKYLDKLEALSIDRFRMPYSELDWAQRVIVYEMFTRNNPEMRIVEQEEDI